MSKTIHLTIHTLNPVRPQIVRVAECLTCGERWVRPVIFSPRTVNLTGEERADCAQCNSRPETSNASVASSPWLLLIGEKLYNLDLTQYSEQPTIEQQ